MRSPHALSDRMHQNLLQKEKPFLQSCPSPPHGLVQDHQFCHNRRGNINHVFYRSFVLFHVCHCIFYHPCFVFFIIRNYLKLQKPVPVSSLNFFLIVPPLTGLSSISAVYNTLIDLICPAETQCLSPSLYENIPCA